MKRKGNIYHLIYDLDNLRLADKNARKGKKNKKEIALHDLNKEANILKLHEMLKNKTFTTSPYKTFTIFEEKKRVISKLPYFPDRILQHALINILSPIITPTFTSDTYSCIKGMGMHKALYKLKRALKEDSTNTKYCLKLDIAQYFPSVKGEILKQLFRRKIKDNDVLWLLDNIIESSKGIPIGNYTSQLFGNFYLMTFSHWLKEKLGIKHLYIYCDDIVILSGDKNYLRYLLTQIKSYLADKLNLTVKSSHRIFPVRIGIDFLGYVSYPTHTLLRKRIKQRFLKMMKYRRNEQSIASYNGWLQHCNSKNLIKSININ